jgi:cellulose synthase/poly-beta-1,6-N-acetylglucosamine synthase-like glycosyltransferase
MVPAAAQVVSHTSEMSISVIIPVRSGGDAFGRCLDGVMRCSPPAAEVIVVLDGPDAQARETAERSGATVAELPVPAGRSAARNLGAHQARGQVLLFVDADVLVPLDVLSQAEEAFRQDPGVAAVFGSYDDAPAAANFLSQYRNLLHHYVHQTGQEEASTFWSGCGAVRRSVFLSVGGFDEKQLAMEDIDLGYRLKRAGHRIRLLKSLQVKHLKRWTVGSLLQADLFERAVPWSTLILRERRFVNDLNTSLSGRVSVGCACALLGALLASCWWPVLRWFALALAMALLFLNAPVYAFFWRKRGGWFALAAIPWHWAYFLYSGLGFAIAAVRHCLRQDRRPASRDTG